MAELGTRLRAAFDVHFGGAPDLVARAPGRVNLIGEHTDYNDGWVLPMAISGETQVAARRRDDLLLRIHAIDLGDSCEVDLAGPILPDRTQPWSNYPRGVAAALQAQGLDLCGADLAIAGTVPQGAGLSSSAALEVATGLALATVAGASDYDRTQLALAGQRAEHDYAGCQCGIMDQLVSARAVAGKALLIDCRSLETVSRPVPNDLSVMIVHSGVERGLVEGKYNLRRAQCVAAALHYGVSALRDLDLDTLEGGKAGLNETAYHRARHVLTENARVLAMAGALAARNLAVIGQLMAQSHTSMRDDFAITVPPIDTLVTLLQDVMAGAGGARMTGGGFGGAVVAVMPADLAQTVSAEVQKRYRTPAGTPPLIMIERPALGASLVG